MDKEKLSKWLNITTLALGFLVMFAPDLTNFFAPWPRACKVVASVMMTVARFAALVEVGKGLLRRLGVLPSEGAKP